MEEAKIFAFLRQHWPKCLLSVAILICVATWIGRYESHKHLQNQRDYVELETCYTTNQQGTLLSQDQIASIQEMVDRHPEMESQFQPLLVLQLFAHDNIPEALPYVEQVIQRSYALLPEVYREYVETTRLIVQAEYEKAFQQAQRLQETVASDTRYANLYGMNTLRLLCLADKLGLESDKLSFWQHLQQQAVYLAIEPILQAGELSFAHFVKAPKSSLPSEVESVASR